MHALAQAKRLRQPAVDHFVKTNPALHGSRLQNSSRSITHASFWYRPPWPWAGVLVKPQAVADYHCVVYLHDPLVQFFSFPGVPTVPKCPSCLQTHKVEGNGYTELRYIHSTHAMPGASKGNVLALGKKYKHPNCPKYIGKGKDRTTTWDNFTAQFQSQLPYFVLGLLPFVFTDRSGIDKGNLEGFRSLLTKLEASRQAASYNEQRVAAHVNIEYCYLHYHSALHKGISEKGALCSFQCEDSSTSSPMALSPQHMVISPPPQVTAGLRAPPAGAPSQSPYQHAAPWLQSGAFAQASPLTFAMVGQAAAQPQSQAAQFSQHAAAAQPVPIPPMYQAAAKPQLAPVFQQAAAAAAASDAAAAATAPGIVPFGGKKLRDHAAGKGSNVGTDKGGTGVAKTCRACLQFDKKTVHRTAAHNRDCPYCAKCAQKKKMVLKMENGLQHSCPYK